MPADRASRRDGALLRLLVAGDGFVFPRAKAQCRGVRAMGGLVRAGADVVLFFASDRTALTLAIGGAAETLRAGVARVSRDLVS